MTVLITLTTAGADTGPFDLYSNVDGYVSAFGTGVSKAALVAGYFSAIVPNGTTTIRIKSTGTCVNYIDVPVTTTTSTTTTQLPIGYNSYFANKYQCSTCTLVDTGILVIFPLGQNVVLNNFYPDPLDSTYVYKIIGPTSSTTGYSLDNSFGSFATCGEACSL